MTGEVDCIDDKAATRAKLKRQAREGPRSKLTGFLTNFIDLVLMNGHDEIVWLTG